MSRLAPLALIALLAPTGCTATEEEEWQYGAAEMEAAIAGQWEGTLEVAGGAPAFLSVSLERLPPSASPACGNRQLNSPQCMATSSMRFDGVVTTDDGRFNGALVQAELTVDGTELSWGYFNMSVGDGSTFGTELHYPELQPGTFAGSDGAQGTFELLRPLD